MLIAIVITLIILMLIGTPIAFSLMGSSLVGFFMTGTPLQALAQKMMIGIAKYSLLPLPFFVFSGAIMGHGGISKRLIRFVQAATGHVTGGVAIVTIISAMIFAALSGSSSATTAALGSILIPAMVEYKYSRGYAGAITAVSSELGMIIPPSISMIIYAVITETSIAKIFAAGFGPGVLIGVTLILYSLYSCKKKGYTGSKKATKEEFLAALKDSWLSLLMPVVVLGGIYTGIFTATESAIISVVYAFILGAFVYKEISFRKFVKCIEESLITIGMITMVIAAASGFSFLLTRELVPQRVATSFGAIAPNAVIFLLLVNILLVFTGMFFDSTSAVTVLAGILAPVAAGFGVDPIHFGVIMVVNMALGCTTPPVGVNLFVACRIGKVTIEEMTKELIPYWAILVTDLMLITYIPAISMTIPNLMH